MTLKWSKGEVVYQQPKGTVKVEPVYEENGKFYVKDGENFVNCLYNGFNGYLYRQDGK